MLKPRWAGTALDRRHGPLPLLAVPSASRLFTPNLMSCLSRVFDFLHGKYLRDTHKPEAILLSLTPLVFERFLPSLTLWLSPNCVPEDAMDFGPFDSQERDEGEVDLGPESFDSCCPRCSGQLIPHSETSKPSWAHAMGSRHRPSWYKLF